MLTIGSVLDYIKANLGFPFQIVEFSDADISNYIVNNTLREFSFYLPRKATVTIDPTRDKVPDTYNKYYIVDPAHLEIIRLVRLYFSAAEELLFGHPPLGPFTQFELREWALNVEVAKTVKLFSSFDYTYEFEHPNIVRISPRPNSGPIVAEYETVHAPNLSTIPVSFEIWFKKFALADIKIQLGAIRKRYSGNLRTPFGEIPINEAIGDEGKEEKRELIDKLELGSIPMVVVDVG